MREQLLVRGDSADSVYTPWVPSRGESARCLMNLISGSISGTGKLKWTVETKNTEDLDSAAITVVNKEYDTSGSIARLDTAASAAAATLSYSISSGSDRILIVGYTQAGASAPSPQPTVDYGGQSLTHIVGRAHQKWGDDRADLFYLDDAGITAATGSTITVTGGDPQDTLHAASYSGVAQIISIPETDTGSDHTPNSNNPLTGISVTAPASSAVVAIDANGQPSGASWNATMTEQTDIQDGSPWTSTGSLADKLVSSAGSVAPECTWGTSSQNVLLVALLQPAYAGIKEAETTSGVKELYRYKLSLDSNASEGDFVWYQLMEPIWQPDCA